MDQLERTWINDRLDADIQEFRVNVKLGGWRLAALVAVNVDPTGKGGRPSITGEFSPVDGRISLSEFARRAEIDKNTVHAYYDHWERAAELGVGHVKHAADLTRYDVDNLVNFELPNWKDWIKKNKVKPVPGVGPVDTDDDEGIEGPIGTDTDNDQDEDGEGCPVRPWKNAYRTIREILLDYDKEARTSEQMTDMIKLYNLHSRRFELKLKKGGTPA